MELKSAGIVLKNMGFTNTTFIVQPTLIRVAFYADSESFCCRIKLIRMS